jgi:thiamine kinase-like enzyme
VQQLGFVSEPDLVLVTRYIKGTPLSETVTSDTLIRMAEFLGQWFGRLANIAPHSPADTNWADYLAQYQSGFNPDLLIQQDMTLGQVPICRLILSHNDNALGNFILGADKQLYAVDFEDSRMKPEGWDLITAANALFRRFPDELQTISASLFRGYQLTAKDHGLKSGFEQVIGLAVIACFTDGVADLP